MLIELLGSRNRALLRAAHYVALLRDSFQIWRIAFSLELGMAHHMSYPGSYLWATHRLLDVLPVRAELVGNRQSLADLELLTRWAQRTVMEYQGVVSQALQRMMFGDADDQPPIALALPYVGLLDAFAGSELNQVGAGRSTGLELLRQALSYPRHTRIVVVQVLPLLHG